MQESYDALLVHGYTDTEGFTGNFGERNEMQATAAVALYKAGYAKNIFLAGGTYWGESNPTYGEAMSHCLVEHGVNPENIVIRPETTTTDAEIDTFMNERYARGWQRVASLSTRSHTPRIAIDYHRKGIKDVDQIRAERVLFNIEENGQYPHRDFLKRFRAGERIFIAREAVAITLGFYGLKGMLQRFSDSNFGKQLKAKLDK